MKQNQQVVNFSMDQLQVANLAFPVFVISNYDSRFFMFTCNEKKKTTAMPFFQAYAFLVVFFFSFFSFSFMLFPVFTDMRRIERGKNVVQFFFFGVKTFSTCFEPPQHVLCANCFVYMQWNERQQIFNISRKMLWMFGCCVSRVHNANTVPSHLKKQLQNKNPQQTIQLFCKLIFYVSICLLVIV